MGMTTAELETRMTGYELLEHAADMKLMGQEREKAVKARQQRGGKHRL